MGKILPVGRTLLGRSVNALKRSKAFAASGFPREISPAASTRRYVTFPTDSAHGIQFHKPNLRTELSHTVLPSYNQTTARYMTTSVTDKIENLVQNNKVVVFSKSWCPFCNQTKSLFQSMNVDAEVLELDLMGKEGEEIQMALFQLTNQKSVPNVFVGGKHIGGNDDTQLAARQGKLQELLK